MPFKTNEFDRIPPFKTIKFDRIPNNILKLQNQGHSADLK